ncbi:MBL fold metallo-hydrolase [Bordetella genomosp. 12]|uniref:MBL fold hydrolase n=1 Tax=Bordetella genomosp. 12 TaxID=463035 RepID=A0A261VLB1_9BORD|nr:MBL fold metallo-hydrolase [Bordetella genomosp. 12]OZI74849.1 MBL fold hydrolase [Bordetella genomosp. 12]
MYQIDILIQGFPGRAVCHGGLGWSTTTLLRHEGRNILVDVGAFGVRHLLHQQLQACGVAPDAITDVVLTHAHYDHAVNFTLFPNATVWIGRRELEWAAAQPPGFNPLPELYVRELTQRPAVHLLDDGQAFLPAMTAIAAPGHTPGHLLFYVDAGPQTILFTGDAAKNRAELVSRTVADTADRDDSHASLAQIWAWWQRKPDTLLVPGHDIGMKLDPHGQPQYVGERQAAINAWFGDDLTPQRLDLCCAPATQRIRL